MRYLAFITFLTITIYPPKTFAQINKDSLYLNQKELVGTWQRNYNRIGNGLFQNFQFLSNGTFILDLSGNYDDARSLIKLKGKYRLTKDKLFFTIMARTLREGKIEMVDPGVNSGIFTFDSTIIEEIKEINPKELTDPCFITVIKRNKIKLNDELYYKVK